MKYITILSVCFLCLVACVDDLDTRPYDTVEEDDVWSSNENAQLFVNGIYYILKDYLTIHDLGNSTDDNTANNANANSDMVCEYITSNNDFQWNIFGSVRACNQVINNVQTATKIKEEDKNNLLGQAKFLRAALYYATARKFGRVILIEKVLTPNDELELPRTSTIKETYDFILKDLDDAANMLPSTAGLGYITKGAAYALKTEVCLQGAAYLENNTEKIDYYYQAYVAGQNLINLGNYELDSNYGGMFNQFESAKASPEIILATWYLNAYNIFNNTWMMRLVPNQGGSGKLPDEIKEIWPMESIEGWMDRTPSQDLVNVYEVVDEDGLAKNWDETSYYKNFTPGVDYVSQAIYKNRDARFYETIVFDSCQYFNSVLTMRKGGNMWYENNREGNLSMSKTGYMYKKSVYQVGRVYTGLPTNWNLVHLRLGRSYLNYAEALLRLVGTDKDNGNFLKEAIHYMNEVRTVHGQLPALSENMTPEETWKRYKRERRVELVLENDRYWSLLRWSKEEGLTTVPELNETEPSAIAIAEDGKSFEITEVPIIGYANKRKFTQKRFLLPIPRSEIATNSKLANDQNPGWE